MSIGRNRLCAAAATIAYCLQPAIAQTAEERSTTERFEPTYFETFNPLNALDMVIQIPGFGIDSGDDVRGFGGAAGNVLINGERPSTKSNLENFLSRIPATNVVRIDLVRGASAGLDMRGQTKVVNVITNGETEASTNWLINTRLHEGGRASVYGEITHSRQFLGGDLSLSLYKADWNVRRSRRELFFDGELNPTLARIGHQQHNYAELYGTFEYEREFGDKTTLRMNGTPWRGAFDQQRREFDLNETPLGDLLAIRKLDYSEEFGGYEFGGDIEHDFSDDLSTKLIWYQRRSWFEADDVFDILDPEGAFDFGFLSDIRDERGESILRTQTDWSPHPKHSIEFGIEGAYNFLETQREFADVAPSGMTSTNVPDSPKVEEFRAEAFISDVWQVKDWLAVEPSLKYEVSTLEQSGAFEEERTLRFAKPGLTATFSPRENHQLRLSIEREVAQLDFGDFVSNVSFGDDQVTSGNRELEPEKTWALEAEWEHEFWDDGVLTIVGEYDMVEDVQDLVPISFVDPSCVDDISTPRNECLRVFDGPGNLGEGTRWQFGVESSIPLKRLGLDNARLDANWRVGSSEVDDPTTGEARRFRGEVYENYYIEFRHDLPEHKISWGFDYFSRRGQSAFRVAEVSRFNPGEGDFDIYIETTRWWGLNIRLGVDNVFDVDFDRDRYLFDGPRDTGMLQEVRKRRMNDGALPFIRVKGTL